MQSGCRCVVQGLDAQNFHGLVVTDRYPIGLSSRPLNLRSVNLKRVSCRMQAIVLKIHGFIHHTDRVPNTLE